MTVVCGLAVLGVIVFLHELGHFVAAKRCGVGVEAFSVGMGPVLLHKAWRGTDWRLSLVPLGGYCAMKGEQDLLEARDAAPDSLFGVSPLRRAAIGLAGPLANLILAVAASATVAMTGYTYYAAGPQIRLASEAYPGTESAAADAGLQSGDTVLSINGQAVADFSDIAAIIAGHPGEDVDVTVERAGRTLTYAVRTAVAENGAGRIGVVGIPGSVVRREARRYAPLPALWQGIRETCTTIALTVKGIAVLFRGARVSETLSGPARITVMLGSTVREGFGAGFRTGLAALLQFMAAVSVSLFLMNLLPVPVLDGGLVLLALVEAATGRTIPPKARVRAQYAGLALVAALLVLATAGDITYFLRKFHEN